MKRFLVSILCILYMASATGATVSVHFCMGKELGVGFSHSHDERCAQCGMKKSKSNGCCKDVHKTYKAAEHQQAKAVSDVPFNHAPLPLVVLHQYPTIVHVYAAPQRAYSLAHSPPSFWRTCPIYKQVRNFRI